MKLRLLLNLGKDDARRIGLDLDEAREGETVDVKQEQADELLRKGWATEAGDDRKARDAERADVQASPSGSAKLTGADDKGQGQPNKPSGAK